MLGVAPLIAGGVSLLSGLFGRSSAKKQAAKEEAAIRKANDDATAAAANMNRQVRARADAAALVPVQTSREHFGSTASAGGVDMDGFLAAAERGGFNPLTFLRSGALSLFAQSQTDEYTDDFTCTTGERAMDAALSGTYLPQLSPVISQTKVPGLGEVFGNALTSGTNQYLSDLSVQQQNDFQLQMLKAKLSGIGQRGSYSGPRSGYVPQAFLSGSTTKYGGAGNGGAGASGTGSDDAAPLYIYGRDADGRIIVVPNNQTMPDLSLVLTQPVLEAAQAVGESPQYAAIKRLLDFDRGMTKAAREIITGNPVTRRVFHPPNPGVGKGNLIYDGRPSWSLW